jgi:hypothetical protein
MKVRRSVYRGHYDLRVIVAFVTVKKLWSSLLLLAAGAVFVLIGIAGLAFMRRH